MGRAETVAGLIEVHSWTQGAELGVYDGMTTMRTWLERFPRLCMLGVDTWAPTGGPKQDKETGRVKYDDKLMHKAKMSAYALKSRFGRRLLLWEGTTDAAASYLSRESLDFVFIDADHSTEGVIRDLKNWWPIVRDGGMMLGHDASWPSVRRALEASKLPYDLLPGNVWRMSVEEGRWPFRAAEEAAEMQRA